MRTDRGDDLSLAATLFLVAIDPGTGRLVERRRRRFRKALRRAGGSRRTAVRELRRRGLIRGHRCRDAPARCRLGGGCAVRALRRGIEKGFERPGDAVVFALTAVAAADRYGRSSTT